MNKKQTPEKPEIFAVKHKKGQVRFSRKEFLKTIGTLGAGMVLSPKRAKAEKIQAPVTSQAGLKPYEFTPKAMCFSPDNTILATGGGGSPGDDDIVKLWSVPDGKLLKTITQTGTVYSASFSSDGSMLAVNDGYDVKLLSVPDGNIIKTIDVSAIAKNLTFSPDGTVLVYASLTNIKRLSLPDGDLIDSLDNGGQIYHLCLNADGTRLAAGGPDGITVWSMSQASIIQTFTGLGWDVKDVSISGDGTLVAAADTEKILVWSVPEARLIYEKRVGSVTQWDGEGDGGVFGPDYLRSLSISPDGKTLAYSFFPNTARLFRLSGNEELTELDDDAGDSLIRFSPDGAWLASAGMATLKLYAAPAGTPSYVLFDPDLSNKTDVKEIKETGPATITQSCSQALPAGTACICDCISGSRSYAGGQTVCTCDTVAVPESQSLPDGTVCTCDTVTVGTQGSSSGGSSGGGSHYWYPN